MALLPTLWPYPSLFIRLLASQILLLGSALLYFLPPLYLFTQWQWAIPPPLEGLIPHSFLLLFPLYGISQLFPYLWLRARRMLGASHTLAGSGYFVHFNKRLLSFVFDKGEARPYTLFLYKSFPYPLLLLYLLLFVFHYHIFYYVIYDRPPLNPFFYALLTAVAFAVSSFLSRGPVDWPNIYSEDALYPSRWGEADHSEVVIYEFQTFRYRKTGWEAAVRSLEALHYPRFPPPDKGQWFFQLPDWWQWPYAHDPRNKGSCWDYVRRQQEYHRLERFFYYDHSIRRMRFSYNDVPPIRGDSLMECFVTYRPHYYGAKGYIARREPFYDELVQFDPRLLRRYGLFQDPDTDELTRFEVDVRPRPPPPPFDIEDFWEFQKMMMDPYYFLRKGRPGKFY